jgi:hypothetical protein
MAQTKRESAVLRADVYVVLVLNEDAKPETSAVETKPAVESKPNPAK